MDEIGEYNSKHFLYVIGEFLKEEYEDGKYLIYNIDLLRSNKLYESEDEEFIKMNLGFSVLTDRGDAYYTIREMNLKNKPEQNYVTYFKDFLEKVKKQLLQMKSFILEYKGSFYSVPIKDLPEVDGVMFTLSEDVFCTGLIMSSQYKENEDLIVLDRYKTAGLMSFKKGFLQGDFEKVEQVAVWDDYDFSVVIKGINGKYRIGKTYVKMIIRNKNKEYIIKNIEAPYLLRGTEEYAYKNKDKWQEYIKEMMNKGL